MFNELCRVGALLTLQVTPPSPPSDAKSAAATAPWNWRLPTWHWLYNDARVLVRMPGAPPRRLLHIACDGADAPCFRDGDGDGEAPLLAPRKRRLLEFTRAHVLQGAGAAAAGEAYRPPPFGF